MKFYFEINQKSKRLLKKKTLFDVPLLNTEKHYFFLKRVKIFSGLALILFLSIFSARIANVHNIFISLLSIPKAFISLFKYFCPTMNSIKHSKQIVNNYFKTMLMAVSSTTFASLFALILAIFSANFPKKKSFSFYGNYYFCFNF